MRSIAIVALVVGGCTGGGGIVDDSFDSLGGWDIVQGSPVIDTGHGDPAPSVDFGAPPADTPANLIRSHATFHYVGPTTFSADIQIDPAAASSGANVTARIANDNDTAWIEVSYSVGASQAIVTGCPALVTPAGVDCPFALHSTVAFDGAWHSFGLRMRDGGLIEYSWDGIVQGNSGSEFASTDVLHAELYGDSQNGTGAVLVDNARVTQ